MLNLNHPLNWYACDVSGSFQLLHVYVDDIERQVEKSVQDFHSTKEVVMVDLHLGEEGAQAIEIHKGLADDTWDLKSVFEDYFPDLQRKSALITLCAFFEHEFERLCHLLRKQESYALELSDMHGNGVHRASTYLEKVAGVDPMRSSVEWAEIQDIQRIRNMIVHKGGKLIDSNDKRINAALAYVDHSTLLKRTDEVLLKCGYLDHVLLTFRNYFKLIEHSIQVKYCAKPFR